MACDGLWGSLEQPFMSGSFLKLVGTSQYVGLVCKSFLMSEDTVGKAELPLVSKTSHEWAMTLSSALPLSP